MSQVDVLASALRDVGGFQFWQSLPLEHCGEDALAQLRVMARHGGCGLIPSGVYHQELPTTVVDRRVNAPAVLPVTPPPAKQRAAESGEVGRRVSL